jgi:chaperonin GroEL
MQKLNLYQEGEVRERILSGVSKMSALVGMTLGPDGRSVIIERGAGEPLIVDDGRRVAENIKFDDPVEQLATRVLYGVTRKTDEKAGDGTTTSMVLAHAILNEVFKNRLTFGAVIGAQASVAAIDAEIQTAKTEVIAKLETMARRIKTEKELINVATVSVGDKGYRFSGGYAASWMITDALRRNCVLDGVDVLITKKKLIDFTELAPIANMVGSSGKNKLIVIAPKFDPSVLKLIYSNATRQQQPFIILGVRAPGRTEEAYRDMAIFTGAKYFSENDDLSMATKADLGYVSRIEVTDDTCILIDGNGNEAEIKKRIKEVEAEAKAQKLPQFRQDRYERLSSLSGGVGLIKIGAPTDEERNWLKYKIEDAKHATKAAYKYGILPGGGLAFKKIAESLPDTNILKKPLLAPYERLKANAGGKFNPGKDVFDPLLVEKTALENACSAASKLIRIGGAIATKPKPEIEEALKAILPKAEANNDEEDE